MREKLQQLLYDRYPNLYQKKDGNMKETGMVWGISCGPGWFQIIDTLSGVILRIDPEAKADQVKEKFGTLRFYSSAAKTAYGAIYIAEEFSSRVCEDLGLPGLLCNNGGWYRTLSPEAIATRPKLRGDVRKVGKQFQKRATGNDGLPLPPLSLDTKLALSKEEAASTLRCLHPEALKNACLDFPGLLLDLLDCAVEQICKVGYHEDDKARVKISAINWNPYDGLAIVPSFISMDAVAQERFNHEKELKTNCEKDMKKQALSNFNDHDISDDAEKEVSSEKKNKPVRTLDSTIQEIAAETEAAVMFVTEMAKRIEISTGRCGPVDDDGKIIDLLPPPKDPMATTRQMFEILRSYDPEADFQPTVFARKSITATLEAHQNLVSLLYEKSVKIELPKIYSRANLFFRHATPSPFLVAAALARQNNWRVALPFEMSQFLMGKTHRPGLLDVATFYYDQLKPRCFEKLNLVFEPVLDKEVLHRTVAGQAIYLHVNQERSLSNIELLKDAQFAAQAWFSNQYFLKSLKEDLRSGLSGKELFLATAILNVVGENLGVQEEAPVGFDPAEHDGDSPQITRWWMREEKDGKIYLSAARIDNHPHISDGDSLRSSTALVWFDLKLGWARTRSRYYRLIGEAIGGLKRRGDDGGV